MTRGAGRIAARSAVAVLAVILAGSTGVGAAVGQEQNQNDPLAQSLPSHKGLPTGDLTNKIEPKLANANGVVTAFVELDKKPAVDAFNEKKSQGGSKDQAKQAAKDAKADTAQTTDKVVADLTSKDAATTVVAKTANAVPGITVTANADKIRELAARPDVKAVYTTVPKERTNADAVQLTKALNVWQQYGKFGDGVRVAIIDDGLDYTHADFGGPGTPEAYKAIDSTKVDPSYFPTAKVVGGYDLAGNNYDGAGKKAPNKPVPDPNPLACGEHGTHVAGSLGGFGVNADGSTFRGDYSKLTSADLDKMRIGPGTAPNALLYSFKVFGCEGSTNLTSQAMDMALDPAGEGDFSDHVDIVSLSLGSDFGAPDDPDSLFVKKLVANNVLPVIAEGNGGDLYDVGGSPGNSVEALTVASTRDGHALRDGAEVTAPADVTGVKAGQYSQAYTKFDTLNLTKPVVAMSDAANKDGCLPFSAADKAAVAGKFVWLEWDDNDASRRCGSVGRSGNAKAAGAAGALFSSTVDTFGAGITGDTDIPVYQFTGSASKQVRPALAAGTLQVRLDGKLRTQVPTFDAGIVDTPSSFTSRGVRGPAVKPDVAAPGQDISSALRGSGNDRLVISGTSMATPHVAGITALVRQVHPDWTPEEVKASVMNTANNDVYSGANKTGSIEAPQRVGAGRIDAKASIDNQVLAMNQDDPGAVSVSFGTVEVGGPVSLTKTIKVVNKGVNAVELGAAYQAITQIPGVSYQLSSDTVKLNPKGVSRIKLTLKIDDPSALRKTIDPTVQTTQLGVARQFLADASGRVVLTPRSGSTVPLRVPVYSAPKPVSKITTADSLRFRGSDTQEILNVKGKGVDQGTGTQAYRSLISVLELQGSKAQLPECKKNVIENCTLNKTAKGGDLRYVGVTSTAPLAKEQGKAGDSLLAFGLVTWGNWYNLGSNTIPAIDIDTNGDGKPDFEVFVTKPSGTDVLLAQTVDLNKQKADGSFQVVDQEAVNGQFGDVDTNVFDTNTIVLPVALTALGIDPSKDSARISYTASVAGFYTAPGDKTGLISSISTPMSFDPLKPGLWTQGGGDAAIGYVAKPGTALVVNRDAAAAAVDKSDSLLVIDHHNASGDRAHVVKVNADRQRPAPGGRPGHRLPGGITAAE
ncbi:S8 family serine peptidase [Solihabitans fulvus]|uniref:S8 family serine peptidase n=1 Tax=Solihabitans fulvus TaxID=1892852 RepID=A0A5B2WPW8_9PSEU|nr:S8 family serine peptidase [Solihabitans fulvus]KAA2253525.1 S8 family serine peptidase [Solihabitans fulvus]